jgi:hypothetical protein
MKDYVREHKITDILFANNIFQACGSRYRAYDFFLTMSEGCRENPSTAFFKNREKDTLDVQTDTIMPQKMDSVVPPVQPDTLKSISMSDTISKGEDKHEEIVAEPQMPEPSDSVSAQ